MLLLTFIRKAIRWLCLLLAFAVWRYQCFEYFEGAQPRPLLSINHPANGQIMESGDVDVEISILGYDYPSIFHSSSICVALSAGTTSGDHENEEGGS